MLLVTTRTLLLPASNGGSPHAGFELRSPFRWALRKSSSRASGGFFVNIFSSAACSRGMLWRKWPNIMKRMMLLVLRQRHDEL